MNLALNRRPMCVLLFCALALTACSTTTAVLEEPDEDSCEVTPLGKNINCGAENLIVEESLQGAIQRIIEEETWASDLSYLLLDGASYNQFLAPLLGEADFVPGGSMPVHGFYVAALDAFDDPLRWQQEWNLSIDTTLVEQIVLLPTKDDAVAVFELWKSTALASGLYEINESTEYNFTTTYSVPASGRPNRTCGVQSIAAVSRFVVSVTHLTGGDCRVTPSLLSASVLQLLTVRINEAFPY